MEWSDALNIINDGEGPRLDFKRSEFLKKSPDEIAADLISFANRYGGRILVGVENDGGREGARFNKDEDSLKIINIANNSCSPAVELNCDYNNSSEGDILVINISKRNDMPHAIVHRNGAEIRSRTYYIRTGKRNRLADDVLLRYMFNHKEDPNTVVNSNICVWYYRKESLHFSPIEFPDYLSDINIFLQSLNDQDKEYLLSSGHETIQNFILQILPYAFLYKISWTFGSSWLVKIEKVKGTGITIGTPVIPDLPSDTITVSDIPFQKSTIESNLSIDIRDVLKQFMLEFKVPKDTKITIQDQKTSCLAIKNPLFSIKLCFAPLMFHVGLPSIISAKILADQMQVQDNYATFQFELRLDRSSIFQMFQTLFLKSMKHLLRPSKT